MGVGDISEVPGDAWGPGDTTGGADGRRRAGRERDTGMVGRRARAERDESTEPCGDRVGVGDGTRGEHGACDVHRAGSDRADGLRSDGVGVGDISAVPDDAWGWGNQESFDHFDGKRQEYYSSLVSGRAGFACGVVDQQFSHDGQAASLCSLHR